MALRRAATVLLQAVANVEMLNQCVDADAQGNVEILVYTAAVIGRCQQVPRARPRFLLALSATATEHGYIGLDCQFSVRRLL